MILKTAPQPTPELNTHKPTRHHFESIETGVGCYTFTALFDFDSDEIGDLLHSVLIVDPLRLEEELMPVERAAELRLLEVVAWDWWEGR